MNVSSYSSIIREKLGAAFEEAVANSPDRTPLIKKLVDEIANEVVLDLHNQITDYMVSNLREALCAVAAEMAESMIRNALAGDDKELRNLFDFNEWYMKHAWNFADLPHQWKLIDALALRHPGLIVEERVKQRDAEIATLKRQLDNLNRQIEHLENPYRETSP